MGFWDARLSDLEAQGVQFSDEEVEILERGGRLVHLHPFEGAEAEYYSERERDANGEVVVTVEVIRAISPLDLYSPSWKPAPTTVAEAMDSMGGRAEWTAYPTYPAVVDLDPEFHCHQWDHPYLEWRSEEIQAYSWWNCIPYDPSMNHALSVLVKAQDQRHNRSMWDSFHYLSDMWRDFMDPFDCWMYANHKDLLLPSDIDDIQKIVVCELGYAEEQCEEFIASIASELDEFYSQGVMSFGWPNGTVVVNGHTIPHPHPDADFVGCLPWQPLEQFIPSHETEALDLWQRLNARRRLGLAQPITRSRYGSPTAEDLE